MSHGATAVEPAGTVSVSGQTVTVTFNTRSRSAASFTVTLGNIANPTAGTYNVGNIAFEGTDRGRHRPPTVNTADYTITGGSLSMTITTPDAGQSVDFGTVDPGIPSATAQSRYRSTPLAHTLSCGRRAATTS